MSATYSPVRHIPSAQRSNQITDVEAGDVIDFVDVLGRPARKVQFVTTDAADEIEYRLNNYLSLKQDLPHDERLGHPHNTRHQVASLRTVSHASSFPVYSSTGEVIETGDNLVIESAEIVSLTLSVGATITIICW